MVQKCCSIGRVVHIPVRVPQVQVPVCLFIQLSYHPFHRNKNIRMGWGRGPLLLLTMPGTPSWVVASSICSQRTLWPVRMGTSLCGLALTQHESLSLSWSILLVCPRIFLLRLLPSEVAGTWLKIHSLGPVTVHRLGAQKGRPSPVIPNISREHIFDKGAKSISRREDMISKFCAGEIWTIACQE